MGRRGSCPGGRRRVPKSTGGRYLCTVIMTGPSVGNEVVPRLAGASGPALTDRNRSSRTVCRGAGHHGLTCLGLDTRGLCEPPRVYREIVEMSHRCEVVAPSLIPRRAGERVKTPIPGVGRGARRSTRRDGIAKRSRQRSPLGYRKAGASTGSHSRACRPARTTPPRKPRSPGPSRVLALAGRFGPRAIDRALGDGVRFRSGPGSAVHSSPARSIGSAGGPPAFGGRPVPRRTGF